MSELSIKEINKLKAMPAYYRDMAEGWYSDGKDYLAKDYIKAADAIESLLNAINIPAYKN